MAIKRKALGGAAAIVIVIVSGFEGERQWAYRDSVGVPTVCFGETRGVKMGDHYTHEECKNMLIPRLEEFNAGVDACIHVPLSDKRRAAVVSFSYNIGTGAFCGSTFARKLNAGDPKACDELLKWTRAGSLILTGLERRRQAERKLCMEG